MDERYKIMDEKLKEAYKSWLFELKQNAPQLLGEKYSNPYYSCVPMGWIDSSIRILIVGEEGFGDWARGKSEGVSAEEIQKGQTYCWSSLASYLKYPLEYDLYPGAWHFDYRHSAFWQRARKLAKYGVCAWTNIDLIHIRSDISKGCVLSEEERKILHSGEIKILDEQIKILKPTHVVYAGWYKISLQHELPEIFNILYPNGPSDNSICFKRVVPIEYEGVYHIVAYHPNWGCRQKGYEAWVMSEFEKTI